jgi:Leucine-rich repeat (LRR) protein
MELQLINKINRIPCTARLKNHTGKEVLIFFSIFKLTKTTSMKVLRLFVLACFPLVAVAQNNSILVIQKKIGPFVRLDTLRGAKADSAREAMKSNPQESVRSRVSYTYAPVAEPIFSSRTDSLSYMALTDLLWKKELPQHTSDSAWHELEKLMKLVARYENRYKSDRLFKSLDDLPEADLSSIKNISVRGAKGKLPDKLWKCTSLERLEIINGAVKRLPRKLAKLKSLESIYVVNNRTRKPMKLSRNNTLTYFLFRGSPAATPVGFQKLKSIVQVDLSGCGLNSFPLAVLKCKSLKNLYLKSNNITLKENISPAHDSIESIDFSGNLITSVPGIFHRMPHLVSLNFNANRVESVDKSLGQLQYLSELSFYANRLKEIPEALFELKNLADLDLYFNEIEKIDERISQWPHMQVLYLSNNKLFSLPENIGKLKELRALYVHNNRLSALPEGVSELKNLAVLRANNNYLSGLPAHLDQLSQLENLDLSVNQLRTLPPDVWKLNALRILSLGGNPWEESTVNEINDQARKLRAKNVIIHTSVRTTMTED